MWKCMQASRPWSLISSGKLPFLKLLWHFQGTAPQNLTLAHTNAEKLIPEHRLGARRDEAGYHQICLWCWCIFLPTALLHIWLLVLKPRIVTFTKEIISCRPVRVRLLQGWHRRPISLAIPSIYFLVTPINTKEFHCATTFLTKMRSQSTAYPMLSLPSHASLPDSWFTAGIFHCSHLSHWLITGSYSSDFASGPCLWAIPWGNPWESLLPLPGSHLPAPRRLGEHLFSNP